jgi:hypothetical protein
MQSNSSKERIWNAARNAATFIGLAMLIYNGISGIFGSGGATTAHAQTDPFLSRRVDMIEQHLYTLESRLNQVSTSRPSTMPSLPSILQNDVDTLRTSIDGLRIRLGEVECGVLKLDERTLTAAQRRTTRAGASSDRCRTDFATPIMLSSRP